MYGEYVSVNGLIFNPTRELGTKLTLVAKRRVVGRRSLYIPVLTIHFDAEEIVEFRPLTIFFDEHRGSSWTWKYQTARGLSLLIEFAQAKADDYARLMSRSPQTRILTQLVKDFQTALTEGTIVSVDGDLTDPLGLWWPPRALSETAKLLRGIERFVKWVDGENGSNVLWNAGWTRDAFAGTGVTASFMKLDYRKTASFLGHIERTTAPTRLYTRGLRREYPIYRFPENYVAEFILDGFRVGPNQGDVDTTAMLIAVILIMGGLRSSEPFHLWVNDFTTVDGQPYLYLRHPEHSIVRIPGLGQMTRTQYLWRLNRVPRNRVENKEKAGWKGIAGDMDDARVHWIEQKEVTPVLDFVTAHLLYYITVTRPKIMHTRRSKGQPDHPYLFVGGGTQFADSKSCVGDPYTMSAFREAWKRALNRLMERHDDPQLIWRKENGTTLHGGRHWYGMAASKRAKDIDTVMRAMHHLSPFSQLTYTRQTPDEVDAALRGDASALARAASNMTRISKTLDDMRWGGSVAAF